MSRLIVRIIFQGCQLNEVLIPQRIFPNFACWRCYENFKTSVKLVEVNCRIYHDGEYYSVPGFVTDDGCVPFDHRTKSINSLVQSSLSSETYERWQRCCNGAVECCESMIRNYQVENFFNTCDGHWDGNSCYVDTFPDKTVERGCPHRMVKEETSKCPRECTLERVNYDCKLQQTFPNRFLLKKMPKKRHLGCR